MRRYIVKGNDELIRIIEQIERIIDSYNTDVTLLGYNTLEEVIKDVIFLLRN